MSFSALFLVGGLLFAAWDALAIRGFMRRYDETWTHVSGLTSRRAFQRALTVVRTPISDPSLERERRQLYRVMWLAGAQLVAGAFVIVVGLTVFGGSLF